MVISYRTAKFKSSLCVSIYDLGLNRQTLIPTNISRYIYSMLYAQVLLYLLSNCNDIIIQKYFLMIIRTYSL